MENVYVWNNTSIVQDEVLAQRLGLVALNIDPTKVEFKQRKCGLPRRRYVRRPGMLVLFPLSLY